MAPTDVAIWTEHETKSINSNDTPCTMVMYRTVSNKYITGLYIPSLLLKTGVNFPAWNQSYQSIGNGLLAGPSNLDGWAVKGLLQNSGSDPNTRRLLLAGTTSQRIEYGDAISGTNYKKTLANFVDTTFSIGPGLQVANITGGLHSSLATDKLAQMTPNNFSTTISANLYNPADLSETAFNDQTTTFVKSWTGTAADPNTFYVNANGLTFNTTNWGVGQDNGITLEDIGIFDGNKCVGTNVGQKSSDGGATYQPTVLSTLTWTDVGSTSKYIPTNDGGTQADIYMPTSSLNGYTVGPGHSASAYIRLNNNALGDVNNKVVKGTYIFKLNINTAWPFKQEATPVDRSFTLNNFGLAFNGGYVNPGVGNEDLGAKINLNWGVTGLNTVYTLTDATNISSTTSTKLAYTENIVRVRTDAGANDTRSQDVLYLGDGIANAISILPDKLWNNGGTVSITDQYGLWYNARYSYYISAYNVVTGEAIVNQERQVTTGPATPINWQEAQVADATGNPSIHMEWENPLATGTANTIRYTVTRQAYGGNGVDVSDNITARTFGNFAQVTVNNIATTTYSTTANETLLYGKTFSYTLTANASGNSSTLNQSYTVPDESGGNDVLDWLLDASQNSVATILQSKDYEDNALTYQNNYYVITVPENYTFSDGSSPTEYQIFEKYYLIATILKSKVDASGNKIIFTKYWSNPTTKSSVTDQRGYGVFYNVVAVNQTNRQYSAVGNTKYVVSLPKPTEPYPMPVTNLTATSNQLNKITLNWSVPTGSTNNQEPASFNYIDRIFVYAIINPLETSSHYDHATDISYDFGQGPDASNNINTTTVYRLLGNNLGSGTRSYTHSPLWDNEIVGYRVVTRNAQGIFSGQDPNNSKVGDIIWGTTQTDVSANFYRVSRESYPNLYTFDNTYVQAKTSAPVKAGQVTMIGTASRNNVNANWTVPGGYSTDTPLAYSVSYIYNSSFGSGDLTPSNSILVAVPDVNATSTSASTSYNIPNLVPGSKYTVSTIVYTNMQATHADPNLWTANEPGTKTVGLVPAVPASKEYNTSANGMTTSNYSLIAANTENNVSSGFPIPIGVGHPVYQAEFNGNNLTWKHPQYQAYSWEISGLVGSIAYITCPAHMVPKWRVPSAQPKDPNEFYLTPNSSDLITNYTVLDGDIISIFDVTSNTCLDSFIWNNLADSVSKRLTVDVNAIGTGGFKFQLWKAIDKTLHNIYVISYNKDESIKLQGISINPAASLTKLTTGNGEAVYRELKFAILPNKYRIYHNGVFKATVTDVLEYDITSSSLDDTNKNNYDVTWYTDDTGITSRSNVNSWNINGESPKWTVESATGLLVEEPHVITIRNPTRTNVQYDADDQTNLLLGDNGTQNFTFNSGEMNKISFNVVDTNRTTIHDLFGSIENMTNTGDVIYLFDAGGNPYTYENGVWRDTPDRKIDYDQGYKFKLFTGDLQPRTLTITGKKIRGIYVQFSNGWNFMGHPNSVDKPGTEVLFNTDINDINNTIWSQLVVVFEPPGAAVKGPLYSSVFGGPNTSAIKYGNGSFPVNAGVMTFQVGSMYEIYIKNALTVLIGSLQAVRLKGDFNGDKSVTAADYIALANYLVKINPDYNKIAADIITEASSTNYFANIKSKIAESVGLNDLVYLISYVNSNSSIGFPEENAK